MNTLIKTACILLFPGLTAYAGSNATLIGTAPHSDFCKTMGINGMHFELSLDMPPNRNEYPVIKSTWGFSLKFPNQVSFNNLGVADNCDYFIAGNPISILGHDELFFIQRLTILSVENKQGVQACNGAWGELDIAQQSNAASTDVCTVSLSNSSD